MPVSVWAGHSGASTGRALLAIICGCCHLQSSSSRHALHASVHGGVGCRRSLFWTLPPGGHGHLVLHGGEEQVKEGAHVEPGIGEYRQDLNSASESVRNSAGVGAALSVNSEGRVVFSEMVPGMPAANSGAIHIGDALVPFLYMLLRVPEPLQEICR